MPLLLDMSGKHVVVFGGGEVGLRKAIFFSREAEVIVVSRSFVAGFQTLGPKVRKIVSAIGPEHEQLINEADFIVIATGDRELNDRLEAIAKSNGKYCNRADGLSTFLIPSVVERRNFLVAVSTMGRSPGMSRFLKGEIDDKLGPEFSSMVDLQQDLRERVKASIPDQSARERLLWDVLKDEEIWHSLRHDPVQAREMALRKMGVSDADDS